MAATASKIVYMMIVCMFVQTCVPKQVHKCPHFATLTETELKWICFISLNLVFVLI